MLQKAASLDYGGCRTLLDILSEELLRGLVDLRRLSTAWGMKPYSEDLRTRIVRAVENGMSKSGVARLFGISLSSVKRYSRIASRGGSLQPRKGGGRPPKGLLRKAEAQTREALVEAMGQAISAVSARDAQGFFEHCGYRAVVPMVASAFGVPLRVAQRPVRSV